MLSEFRDAQGALGAFELNQRFTTVGALCAALERLPGVRFDSARGSLWRSRSNHFSFKGREFEISAPFGDVRIEPLDAGATYRETGELLRLIAENLMPKWQSRERSRFSRA
jgi:hypothetical protein